MGTPNYVDIYFSIDISCHMVGHYPLFLVEEPEKARTQLGIDLIDTNDETELDCKGS
jgi:hypothetical protein